MPRYCEHCTREGYVTARCWESNPDNLTYAVIRNGAAIHHYTGPHAEAKALEQARQMAASKYSYETFAPSVRVETHVYDLGCYVHVGRDRRVIADGQIIEEGPDYTPRHIVTKVSRHRVAQRETAPHARCRYEDRCVEPVPDPEKCK